jgi:RNA polymerase primary sigma factor
MNLNSKAYFITRDGSIEQFLKEIGKYPILTAQEERDLFAKYSVSDSEEEKQEIRDKIILSNMRFCFAIAKRYGDGELLRDLVNEGYMGMQQAFDDFDPKRGTRYDTLAQFYVRRAIKGYLTKENLMVRPKNNAKVAPKVRKIENDFFAEHGRLPSASETREILSTQYGIEVKDDIDIYGAKIDKIDAYLGDDEDNTFDKSPAFNEKTAVSNLYEEQCEREAAKFMVQEAMKSLTDREKAIISMAYGYGYSKEYKDKEIGAALGLTSERVRQLRHGAIKKMRAACVTAANE